MNRCEVQKSFENIVAELSYTLRNTFSEKFETLDRSYKNNSDRRRLCHRFTNFGVSYTYVNSLYLDFWEKNQEDTSTGKL